MSEIHFKIVTLKSRSRSQSIIIAMTPFPTLVPLRDLHLMTLTYFLRSNIKNFNIAEPVRASTVFFKGQQPYRI